MDKKAVFQQIIADSIERSFQGVLPRKIEIPVDVPKIISLIGPRRSGKTYVLFYLIEQLRQKISANRIAYINFEDDRLFPLKLEEMDALVKGYYELFPENKDKKVYFFLDEVQEVENWEKFVRRLFDQENCRIFLSGSSSKLLSRELASSLRGRTLPYEIFPLSFQEFLDFNEIQPSPNTSKGEALILYWLKKYFQQGGFPELVFLPESLHLRTINEYIDLMLYRDLTERFELKNPHLIKYLLKHLLNNLSNLLSVNKVFKDLKSQGYRVGKNTVYDYMSYLEEAFIIFRVELWSRSIRKQAINPSKIYAIDPSFKYAMSIGEDFGRVFENMLFLELRRRGHTPHYYFTQKEVDFILDDQTLINTCYHFHEEKTREREKEGLLLAMNELDTEESFLFTWDQTGEWEIEGKKIFIKPLWRFLLES